MLCPPFLSGNFSFNVAYKTRHTEFNGICSQVSVYRAAAYRVHSYIPNQKETNG